MAESTYEKFRKLLAELFMFDRADLDFGIYRIMNAKRDEVTRFFDDDLLPQVKTTLGEVDSGQRQQLQVELEKVEQACAVAGVDPDTSQRAQDLRQALKGGGDPEILEAEVFSHLYSFFRRYYKDGDFISLRRYKEGVYAIPYEGEEVKLYWANHDQYYIKSGEYFRDYAFTLPDARRVHFKLVQADEERDNTKAVAGQERRFILSESEAVREENGELVIPFEYRPDEQKRKRDELVTQATKRVLADPAAAAWLLGLASAAPTGKNPKRTLLERHLSEYTARNSFDYFIHKDLGGFLRRELDFYIKNEVMHLDDIESEGEQRVIQYLAKIKAIRRIAHKIIDFLAQLEDFQKKLWLKKKFVVEANWCVTLDRVPEELYPGVVANDAQRNEWVRLFAIDEIEGDLTEPGYSEPLTVGFLKRNQSLVLDTAHFSGEFRARLLARFDDLDEATDGLLIHAENLQALNLLRAGFMERIDCAYIDPPYNTGSDEFLYRDNYMHSSWTAMLVDRLAAGRALLASSGFIVISINDIELHRLVLSGDEVFRPQNHIATLIWNTEGNIDNQSKIKGNHEYLVLYALCGDEFRHPPVVDPNVSDKSKLLNDTIENSITKNGPANPPSEVTLPAGFPADFEVGLIASDACQWPELSNSVRVDSYATLDSVVARSGWSSRSLLDKFLEAGCTPVVDSKGNATCFKLTKSGAIYGYKERPAEQSHVLSVVRNVGTVKQMAGLLRNMGFDFPYPKPIGLVEYLCRWSGSESSWHMDFFAGSGTTGHAVINVNRSDGQRRRFLLIEGAATFDTVMRPRLERAIYSPEWREGKPRRRATDDERKHGPHLVKYLRLESYEDALNNLSLRRTSAQNQLLAQHPSLRQDYTLRYMLDVESEGSASLLDLDQFEDPFSYTLQIGQGSVGETRPVKVDLVETFNYLIGLRVRHIDSIRGFKVVEGASPQGERALVIWRSTRETSNADLDDFFQKQGYNTRDTEFDVIYVNGDNNLENLRRPDETWKVRLIEDDFKRLMFDVEDV